MAHIPLQGTVPEAELYGLVRASAETLGLMSLAADLGIKLSGRGRECRPSHHWAAGDWQDKAP